MRQLHDTFIERVVKLQKASKANHTRVLAILELAAQRKMEGKDTVASDLLWYAGKLANAS